MNELIEKNGNPALFDNSTAQLLSPTIATTSLSPSVQLAKAKAGRYRLAWRGFWRTLHIVWVIGGFLLYVWLDFRGWLGKSEARKETLFRRHAIRLRERLLRLGPTFIKIGQTLGTRADLLPIQYVDELALLQDRVPPEPNEVAFAIFAEEFGLPPAEVFAHLTAEPVAAASLGQVYRARLKTGEEVAVKIQRPHLHELISFDLSVLKRLARFLDKYKLLRGQDWYDMMVEFDRTVHEEMDYLAEGRNADKFRANFAHWPEVHVPKIHWDLTSRRVLVMEFIHGHKVIDLDSLRAAGHNLQRLNELMVRTYFKQLLEDGFFHADPHPGNLRIMADGRLAFFDFGMVGRITPELQGQMVSAFFHLLERDVDGLIADLISLNFLSPEVDLARFRHVVADMLARTMNKSLKDVKFKELTYDLAPIVYEYPLTTPGHFTYVVRALMTLEGISFRMNPDFNFLEVARPYARDFLFRRESAWLRQQVWQSLRDARSGEINWGRMWNLAKTAYSLYFERA